MDAGVVWWISQSLVERGIAALRFNFRGVGRSRGKYADGEGEIDDLIGALDWLATQREVAAGQLAAVGYSFGAWVAGHAAMRDERLRAYGAVALPMDAAHSIDLEHFDRPKHFVTGAQDTICPPELLRQYASALPEPKSLLVLPGADHFLGGYEQTVADHVADFVRAAFIG
jgi:alpha/beta superfamily hydrolase